ncbi:calcium-binding protein [Phenylobacterium sp.]|jgi:Ca2+-binding RTX toxin-like protein|uniref:calcium-binding protein n=1 Tax=Phenylobacterium sp. TaxID=1871053 RepID=UPI00378308B7
MPATIDFTGTSGPYQTYAEDGFELASDPSLTDPFVGGQAGGALGTGDYLQAFWTSQDTILTRTGGGTFGVVALQVEGFRFNGFDPLGNPIPDAIATTVSFIGVTADGTVTYSFVTDGAVGFETVELPAEFAGLYELHWQATGGAGLILFDDIEVFENRAPVAVDLIDQVAADAVYFGAVAAVDPDGQTLVYEAVGALPGGVGLNADGSLYLEPTDGDLDLLIGQYRTVTFDYRAGDGETWSAVQQVSLRIDGVNDGGQVYLGTSGDDALIGLYGPDMLVGGAGDDTLATGGGGEDVALGEAGDDTLTSGSGPAGALLDGGDGGDRLTAGSAPTAFIGGAGDDTLTAGSGADVFIYSGAIDHGDDRIVGFNPLQDQLLVPGLHVDVTATLGSLTQVGLDVVLSYTDEDMAAHEITLVGVSVLSLTLGNIIG